MAVRCFGFIQSYSHLCQYLSVCLKIVMRLFLVSTTKVVFFSLFVFYLARVWLNISHSIPNLFSPSRSANKNPNNPQSSSRTIDTWRIKQYRKGKKKNTMRNRFIHWSASPQKTITTLFEFNSAIWMKTRKEVVRANANSSNFQNVFFFSFHLHSISSTTTTMIMLVVVVAAAAPETLVKFQFSFRACFNGHLFFLYLNFWINRNSCELFPMDLVANWY